jgi:hypothetical protein
MYQDDETERAYAIANDLDFAEPHVTSDYQIIGKKTWAWMWFLDTGTSISHTVANSEAAIDAVFYSLSSSSVSVVIIINFAAIVFLFFPSRIYSFINCLVILGLPFSSHFANTFSLWGSFSPYWLSFCPLLAIQVPVCRLYT